jgi:hypothetical protein
MFERDPAAFEAGVAEAKREITGGRLRLFSGAPSHAGWGLDLAETMRCRFGIEVIFTSCFFNPARHSFEAGYNLAIQSHIDGVYGEGALDAVHKEVQQRRKESYDAWVAAKKPAEAADAIDKGSSTAHTE